MSSCTEYRRWSRRDFLGVGFAGALTLPRALQAAEAIGRPAKAATNAIFLWLGGGPSHFESFDPKPNAPAETRGEFKPIASSLPGCQVSELMPRIARQMHHCTLIRSVAHTIFSHAPGSMYLQTGNRPLPSMKFPTYGSVVTREMPGAQDIPPYVAVPSEPAESTGGGYLGAAYNSFAVNGDPNAPDFSVRSISLQNGASLDSVGRRTALLHRLDHRFDERQDTDVVAGLDRFQQQAYDIVRSRHCRQAFALEQEPAKLRDQYGRTTFGQGCLLARRLVEAGCRFVTVNSTGWDTHSNNFKDMRDKLMPPTDRGLAALLEDLDVRGLWETTVVFLVGEFGRTPKINKDAGRDHWPYAQFALLAGGPFPRGVVYGATDSGGERPRDKPVLPDDVAATFYQALGIDPKKEYMSATGRPIQIVHDGNAIAELLPE